MAFATSLEENIFLKLAHGFRGLTHCCHSRKQGHMQASIVLQRWLEVYIWIHRQQEEREREREKEGGREGVATFGPDLSI